jgi:hypothetical protein
VVSDNLWQSAFSRRDTLVQSEELEQFIAISTFAHSDAVTHLGKDHAYIFLRPYITPGTAAHESLHVLEESKFPHDGPEAWTYPLGALTEAVLSVLTEAQEQVKFDPTVSQVNSWDVVQTIVQSEIERNVTALKAAVPGVADRLKIDRMIYGDYSELAKALGIFVPNKAATR